MGSGILGLPQAPLWNSPWPLTFSFGRALQQLALNLWAGEDVNRNAAQRALRHRIRCNDGGTRGCYDHATAAEGLTA